MTIARKTAIISRIDRIIAKRAAHRAELVADEGRREGTEWYNDQVNALAFYSDRLARQMDQLSARQQQEIIPRINMNSI